VLFIGYVDDFHCDSVGGTGPRNATKLYVCVSLLPRSFIHHPDIHVPIISHPRSDAHKHPRERSFGEPYSLLAFILANTWSEPEHDACVHQPPVTAVWLTFHPAPCTPGVGPPAVSLPLHARIPPNSLDYIYHARSRIHEHYQSRCRACSHFFAYSPSLPSRWAMTSSGTTAAKTSSMTARGTRSGTFTVPGIISPCAFILNNLITFKL